MVPEEASAPVPGPLSPSDYAAILRPYVTRHVQHDEIEDVLQEVLLRLHQRQATEGIENPKAYAFQAVRSVISDRWRRGTARKQGAHTSLKEVHHPVEHATPERIVEGRQAIHRLVAALNEMPERTRDIFVLHRFEDMSYPQIADHIGISLSAVGKHMVRALRFLAQKDLP